MNPLFGGGIRSGSSAKPCKLVSPPERGEMTARIRYQARPAFKPIRNTTEHHGTNKKILFLSWLGCKVFLLLELAFLSGWVIKAGAVVAPVYLGERHGPRHRIY